jgi:iron complex outermembrane receptor protein
MLATPAPRLAVAVCCAVAAESRGAAAEDKRSFDLPPGDATATLNQFAAAAGQQVMFVTERVRGERTQAVRGVLAPQAALERMLTGTALKAARDPATGVFVVSRRRAASDALGRKGEVGPVSDPQPKPKPESNVTKSPRSLLAAVAGWLAFGTAADAQTAPSAAPDEPLVLSAFEVNTKADRGYRVAESNSASLISIPLRDLPMSVQVLNSEFLRDLQLGNVADIAQFIPGANSNATRNDIFTSRGLQTTTTRNGIAPGGRWYFLANSERVEVVKGASSVLYGVVNPGGVVNFIPKLPQFTERTEVSVSGGSFDTHRLIFDSTGPLRALGGKKLAFRLIAEDYRTSGPGDYETETRRLVSPSLIYRPFNGTTLRVEYEYTDGYRERPAIPLRRAVREADGSFTLLAPGVTADPTGRAREVVFRYDAGNWGLGRDFMAQGPGAEDRNVQHNLSVDFTTHFLERFTLRLFAHNNDRYVKERPGYSPELALLNRPQNLLYNVNQNDVWGVGGNLLAEIPLGKLGRLDSILGYELNHNWFENIQFRRNNLPAIQNPSAGPLNRELLRHDDRAFPFAAFQGGDAVMFGNLRFLNTARLLDDKLLVMAGIARTKIAQRNRLRTTLFSQSDDTVQLGATLKVHPNLTPYAVYAESVAPNFSVLPVVGGGSLVPLTGTLKEGGLRGELPGGKLSGSVAYFKILQSNIARTITIQDDPNTPQNEFAQFVALSGSELAKGWEYTANWQATADLALQITGTFFDARVTADPQDPTRIGLRRQFAPKDAFAASLIYEPVAGDWRGFSAMLTVNQTAAYPTGSTLQTRYQFTDRVTHVNLSLRYRRMLFERETTFSIKGGNLLDRIDNDQGYWTRPRTFLGSVGIRF